MAFSITRFLKGLLITQENTLTPKEIEIVPGGTGGFKTIITSSQTANRTITLPDTTDTLVSATDFTTHTTDTTTHGTTGDIVGTTDTQTLSNKTLDNTSTITVKDSAFTIQDDTDTSKQIKLQASGITTATTRTLTVPDADITLAGTTNSQTLSNKVLDNTNFITVKDNQFSIQDNVDSTKYVTFEVNGVTTGTTRVLAIPDADTTIVGTGVTQTLTNKTLTSPTINNPTVGGSSVDASAPTTVLLGTSNTASSISIGTGTGANTVNIGGANTTVNITGTVNNQNVTNLNVTDKLITLNDGGAVSSGAVSGIEIEENAVATGYIKTSADRNSWELKAPNTAGVTTLTPGSGSDTITLNAATQTLTNKTLTSPSLTTPSTDVVTLDGQASTPSNPSSGFYKAYVKDSTGKLTILDSSGVETTVGSGSSGINYINATDGTAIGDWTTYADAAGTNPVDGTGGSPTVTYAVSTNSDMRGTSNFLFTHAASNQQGQGFSYNFTIDPSDKGKVLQLSFEYLIASGTYADDGLQFWIYDVTNAALIQPVPYKIKNSGIIEKFAMEFQTSSSSTSYRLIGHVATSTATAYTIRFDNWNLGPQAKLYGSPITDWVSYTPTWTGSTTNPVIGNGTISGKWRKVGDSAEIQIYVNSGTTTTYGSGRYIWSFPSGLTLDTSKTDVATNGVAEIFGNLFTSSPSTIYTGTVNYESTTSVTGYTDGTTARVSNGAPFSPTASTANQAWVLNFKVPILGWSSSVVMSSDAATTVVAASAYKAANQTGVNTNNSAVKITLDTVAFDRQGAFDTTNNRYVVKVPGDYDIETLIYVTGTNVLANYYDIRLYKNGSLYAYGQTTTATTNVAFSLALNHKLNLVAGDYLELYLFGTGNNSASTLTVSGGFGATRMNVERISGSNQIAASETVSAKYSSAVASTLNGGVIKDYATKVWDTHGAVTTGASWKFTAPISGKYSVKARLETASLVWAAGQQVNLILFKGGVSYETLHRIPIQATGTLIHYLAGAIEVELLAGEYIDVRSDSSVAGNTGTSAGDSTVTITRVGNY